jgi:hypothetical protein
MFVCTTPDNPIRPNNLDELIKKFIIDGLHELITEDNKGYKTGALHLISKYSLENNCISGYLKSIKNDGIDIHYEEDFNKLIERYSDG